MTYRYGDPQVAFEAANRRISRALRSGARVVNLSGLGLRSIPRGVSELFGVEVLDLSNNGLSSIPDSIFQLSTLRELALSDNEITTVPSALLESANLERLHLHNNRITVLPDSISELSNLRVLSLHNNYISAIPVSLAELTELKVLTLDGNPLQTDLKELIALGWPRLRDYLQESSKQTAPQWRVKLLLVGEGGVGKTNLLRRLKGEAFIPKLDPTHSLEIRDLALPHPTEPSVEIIFRSWDFGGQDFYHATHQFFYSGKSIFFVVWNARENIEQGKLTSWLDRIQALSPASPILLVATWCDKVQPNIPLAELREKYPQVVDLYRVDNESGNGIPALREALRATALTIDHVGRSRPTSWIRATDAIRHQPREYTTFEEFRRIALSSGVREFDTFAEYMCHTGEITFFPKNPIYQPEQSELADWVVLKPDWLLQRVSLLITDKQIESQKGVVHTADQRRVWTDCDNLVQEYLLRMMDHFDLAYRTEIHPVRSIVVELCPEDRPADVLQLWDEASSYNQVALEYHFETTIPPGFPTWFIARSHRFTKPERHWRRGALLSDGHHRALLQADLHGRKVYLAARGPVPVNFFALLRDCFEGTLSRFPGLASRVDRVVPCPTSNCRNNFKVADLESFLSEDETVRCYGCKRQHPITALLFGIHPAGSSAAIFQLQHAVDDFKRDIIAYLDREFTELFHRDQSLNDTHCPSVFTLEYERLPSILPTVLEGWEEALLDSSKAATLTLYCEEPGDRHPVKPYQIPSKSLRLAELAPHLKKLATLFKVAGPMITSAYPQTKVAIDSMKSLAEAGSDYRKSSVDDVPESRDPRHHDGLSLYALRRLLDEIAPKEKDHWGGLFKVCTKQFHYLWLCEKHARPHLAPWPRLDA